MKTVRITTWWGWYRFARETLEMGEREAHAYADTRFVEDQNRERSKRAA